MSDLDELPADLLDQAEHLIAQLRGHPDPTVGERLEVLLEGIDAVHRTGLTRLVSAIHGMAGDAFIHRLCGDPAVRLLLMSYDLVAVDRRILTEEALDPVRAHLHAHGIDVELADVVGGVVYVRLHPEPSDEALASRIAHDLEAALREGLPGFQELELGERRAGLSPLVQLTGKRPARRPVYRRTVAVDSLDAGCVKAIELDEVPILLARVDGQVHAVRNRCGDSPLPLEFGRLEGATLTCSWHGCRYDVRTGGRVDGGPERLDVFPARVAEGLVEVAVATEPVPPGDES